MSDCIHQWLLQYRLVGSITKVRQSMTSNIHTMMMAILNDVLPKKLGQIFLSNPEILALNQIDIVAPWWYEWLHSPMIAAVDLLGPLPRSDKPWQATYTLWTCQTTMMCCEKLGQFFVKSWNSCPEPNRYRCTMMVWVTAFTNDCCSRLVGSITKVWQPYWQAPYTLGWVNTPIPILKNVSNAFEWEWIRFIFNKVWNTLNI